MPKKNQRPRYTMPLLADDEKKASEQESDIEWDAGFNTDNQLELGYHADYDGTDERDDNDNYNELLSGEDFLQALQARVQTRPALFALDLETYNSLYLLVLVCNAARRYPVILTELSAAIKAIQYLRCIMPEILIDIVALDGATVKTEGLGITTTLACLLSLTSFFLILNESRQYYITRESRKIIKDLAHFVHQRQRWQYEALALTAPHLKHLQLRGLNQKALDSMVVPESRWRSFTREISAFNVIVGKYTTPVALASSIVGFVMMCLEAQKMKAISGCDITDLITDECPVLGRYDIMATEIFPWIAISAGTLGFYSLTLTGRLLGFGSSKVNAAGSWLHQKVHIPYTTYFNLRDEDEDKWIYPNLFWDVLFYPFMVCILTYAIAQAYTTANAYEDEIGCEHLIPFVGLILNNEKSKVRSCSAAQMILSIIGFLSDLELSKVYPMYLVSKNLSYGLGALYNRYCPDGNKMSVDRAKSLHKTIMEVHQTSQVVLLSTVILVGLPLISLARNKADETLQNGLEVIASVDFSNFISPYLNQTQYANMNMSTLIASVGFKDYLHDICPFDDLMPLVSQTITEFPQLINGSFPLTLLGNSSVSYLYGQACPGYNIISLYARSLIGLQSSCNALVEARSVTTFVGIYWTFISGLPIAAYILTTAVSSAHKAYKLCRERRPENALSGVEMPELEAPVDVSVNNNARPSLSLVQGDRHRLFSSRRVEVKNEARTPLLSQHTSFGYGTS